MKKFVILYFLLFLCVYCMADKKQKIFDRKKVTKVQQEISKFLGKQLQQRTQRKGVKIVLKSKIDENHLSFFLATRYTRDTLFYIRISDYNTFWKVQGRILHSSDKAMLKHLIESLTTKKIIWEIDAGVLGYGIISVPLADLYVFPKSKKGSNLASQLLYGTPILILECTKGKKFFRIQGKADGYIGWVKAQSFTMMTSSAWLDYCNAPKTYLGKLYSQPALYPGTTLCLENNRVFLFHPKRGKQPLKVKEYTDPSFQATTKTIVNTAKRFSKTGDLGGITYLWGGTCIPQLDCSGFVQMTYKLNNILLPRDADQQYQYSTPVDRKNMKEGDLIFFSKHGKHPTHVGIYLGKGLYIHCSPSGGETGVKINDLAGKSKYDQSLNNMFYGAGRIIND